MFIPYELWQEVYVFDMWSITNLIKWNIKKFVIDNDWIIVIVSTGSIESIYDITKIYPCKSIAKQALLEMSVGRISKALED